MDEQAQLELDPLLDRQPVQFSQGGRHTPYFLPLVKYQLHDTRIHVHGRKLHRSDR